MKHVFFGIALVVMVANLQSCRWLDPDEPTPAFLRIDSFDFTSQPENGSSSEKISEIWVFADGETIGAYDLPATVPILKEGAVNFSIRAGIKNNGISATRILYPFYTPYDVTLNMVPGETVSIAPEFTYVESALVISNEDFESAGTVYENGEGSQVDLEVTDDIDEVFEGDSSGKVVLQGDGITYWQGVSTDNFPLPSGKLIFAELNYKSNNTFAVGLYSWRTGLSSKDLVLIINPTTDDNGIDQWNKIYVDLTNVAASNLTADDFQLYIECNRDDVNDQARLFFDNIKILHFE